MARGRKSRPAPAPSSVSKDTFIEFLETIDGYKQKLSDAQMANASAWKKAVVQLSPADKIEFFEGR